MKKIGVAGLQREQIKKTIEATAPGCFEVFISAEKASLGFPLQAIQAGEWELQLNVHCAASEKIYGSVSILAERMEEL